MCEDGLNVSLLDSCITENTALIHGCIRMECLRRISLAVATKGRHPFVECRHRKPGSTRDDAKRGQIDIRIIQWVAEIKIPFARCIEKKLARRPPTWIGLTEVHGALGTSHPARKHYLLITMVTALHQSPADSGFTASDYKHDGTTATLTASLETHRIR